MRKWRNLSLHVVSVCTLIIFTLINLGNLFYYNADYFPIPLTGLNRGILTVGFLVLTAGWFFVMRFVWQHLADKLTMRHILLLAIGLRVLWILAVDTPPVQDFSEMYQAAVQFAGGQLDFASESRYLSLYPYQVPFVMYQGIIIKLLGEHVLWLKLLNCIISTVTIALTIMIGKQFFSTKQALMAGLMLTLYPPHIVLNSVLTNQIIALCLFLAGIYLFLQEKDSLLNAVLCALFLTFGNLFRPLGSILLIAFGLYAVCIRLPVKKHKGRYLLTLLCLPVIYFSANQLVDTALMTSGITADSIQTVNPYWKFAVGLNQESDGKWTQADYDIVTAFDTAEERNDAARQLLAERLDNPPAISRLLVRKFLIMWSDIDTSLSWGTKQTGLPQWAIAGLSVIQKTQYMMWVFCGTVYLIKKRRQLPDGVYVLLIIIIGYVLVHEGIEIQTRYRYVLMPFFSLLAAAGLPLFTSRPHKQADQHQEKA
ncbi:ArnT family glycosyltransferase [Vagococcus acidifermentans]|uniref:Glycosyltransferase RgtA/B/C/D-like domain-containing protein n=1 Tax=Vagococcus acidifermentans TaxID=564710 RepID=A0A430B2H1_9ENTE|nr:hypothetical protein CBF27_00635 [Vagococcus acidifermentans]